LFKTRYSDIVEKIMLLVLSYTRVLFIFINLTSTVPLLSYILDKDLSKLLSDCSYKINVGVTEL